VTELRLVRGMVDPVIPLERATSILRALGDLPEPFIALTLPVLASKKRQNASLNEKRKIR
jgi:hypothetical protein